MVVIGHLVDLNWKLQKCVLSFIYLPPLYGGIEIIDSFYKCLNDWRIENKVFMISVDNASSNDKAIRTLREGFKVKKKLFFEGRLFHIHCCAHILNLMMKDGLKEIELIIHDIWEIVNFLNSSEFRLLKFGEVVQQYQLPARKLILDCPTH